MSAAHRGHLQVTGLTLSRGGRDILRDVTFTAEPGSTVHIQGSDIDDQASLLGLLLGLHPLPADAVVLDGTDVAGLPLAESRRRIAVVMADPWLLDGTVGDNIRFGRPDIGRDRIHLAARLAGLEGTASVSPIGLGTPVGPDGSELSLALRRQVALARALATDPAVLLLEEPFDLIEAREATELIRALNRACEGRTTIVAARRSDAIRAVDDSYRIVDGHLVRAHLPAPTVWRSEIGQVSTPAGVALVPSPADRTLRCGDNRRSGDRSARIEIGAEIAPGFRAAGLLDRGPHTETWLAWSRRHTDAVAIRVPRRRPVTFTAHEELSREYRICRELNHSGIAAALDADLEAEIPFLISERVAGRTLAWSIARGEPIVGADLLSLALDLTRSLDHLHRRGFVHLDLRPDNVIRAGRRGAVIADLRFALAIGEQRVRFIDRHRHGFVAPELIRGAPAAPAADLHALGSVLFQVVCGTLVDDRERSAGLVVLDHRGERRRRPVSQAAPDVDPQMAYLIEWLLTDDPADRPTTGQVLSRLRPLLLRADPGGTRAA